MSSYRPPRGRGANERSYRPMPNQHRNDFYDDRSRSHSRDGRYTSARRSTPSHDASRTPPRGPAANGRYDNRYNERDWDRPGDASYARGEYRIRRSPSPIRGRASYRDRDREGYRSPSHNSRTRSRSRTRTRSPSSRGAQQIAVGGQPTREIMMDGLSAEFTEDDIREELEQHYHVQALDDVRIIRDRQTRQSRGFGFLRFATLQEAQTFMERNQSLLYLYGKATSDGNEETAKVRLVYSREKPDHNRDKVEGDWICKICSVNNYSTRNRCFRCQAFRAGTATLVVRKCHVSLEDADAASAPSQKLVNTGDNDTSPDNTPSQFLLLRGLEPSVSEELLAKGVAKLYKPSGNLAQAKQPVGKKGAKVASTTGDANLGAREGTLRRILLVRDRKTNESWRFGFAEYATVEDAQAALTRYNSFDKFTIASKPVLASYIHAGVFVPIISAVEERENSTFSPLANPSVRLAYWDEQAYVTELTVSVVAPKTSGEKPKAEPATVAAENEGLRTMKDNERNKKRKAEPLATTASNPKKAAPSHLQFWSNRHAELHGIEQKTAEGGGDVGVSASRRSESEEGMGAPPTQSYADPDRSCCYICYRQFRSTAEVNRHERLSKLHRQNLKDETLVARAKAKLKKHGVEPHQATVEYRDRAKERRKAYGVVNKKGQQVAGGGEKSSKATSEEDEDVPIVPSKGASLLGKMGYTPGSGLGVSGHGMTGPINQDVYVAGVGLGAQGGKVGDAVVEAERNTRGDYSDFAKRTREGAKERYDQLQGS